MKGLNKVAVVLAASQTLSMQDLVADIKPKKVLKAAKGRGNQGDWATSQKTYDKNSNEIISHNEAIEYRRQQKQADKRARRAARAET